MFMITVEDDNDNVKSYYVNKYNIDITDDLLILELVTDKDTLRYDIYADDRHKDISLIEKFISKKLKDASMSKEEFKIREYLIREYIYIGDNQFTAHKK